MIRTQTAGGIATLLIDNPGSRNALNAQMVAALAPAIAAAEADPACRCLVVKGAGGDFCAGRDLGDASTDWKLEQYVEYDAAWSNAIDLLWRSSKPSVAVVQGYAVAGGFTLAMACDFALAEEGAKFGALEMRRGFPAAVNTAVLAHKAGPRLALELLLSAGTVAAPRLYEMGLLNRVASGAAALGAIEAEFAGALAALDPMAVRLTKETYRAAVAMPYSESMTLGSQLNSLLMASGRIAQAAEDYRKGKSA
jgi:enoyl-CoA hydratase/carnithine racemase